MDPELNLLALLLWHLDASDGELKDINVSRDDVLRLARTFEGFVPTARRDHLIAYGKYLLVAYRYGQMDGPPKSTV